MNHIDDNQKNIRKLLLQNVVFDENPSVTVEGKNLLEPRESLPRVSEVIKDYIKEQFSVLNSKS